MLSATCSKLARVIPKSAGALSTLSSRLKHTLPDLPYDYNALEPYISAEIMQLHHQKHHKTYVDNLNIVEEKLAEAVATNNVSEAIRLQSAVRFNGGGHINHSIFWETLSPHSETLGKGDLRDMICRDFGSVEEMQKELTQASIGIQGSGWGWLAFNPVNKHLKIVTCANQDPLEPTTGNIPLFGIDVWEHAYYLQYKNVRPDYVKAIWHIVNWENVSKRLHEALMKT